MFLDRAWRLGRRGVPKLEACRTWSDAGRGPMPDVFRCRTWSEERGMEFRGAVCGERGFEASTASSFASFYSRDGSLLDLVSFVTRHCVYELRGRVLGFTWLHAQTLAVRSVLVWSAWVRVAGGCSLWLLVVRFCGGLSTATRAHATGPDRKDGGGAGRRSLSFIARTA